MSPRQPNNFEKRYFDQLDENFKVINSGIKEVRDELRDNTSETRRINSRVTNLEGEVFDKGSKKETIKDLIPIWRDPKVLTIITILAVVLLIVVSIIAFIAGAPVPKGLF